MNIVTDIILPLALAFIMLALGLGLSGGDFIQMSLKDGASDSFVYGEDEYDHPNPTMDSFIDLYFDKDEWLGQTDHNGIIVDNPYFSHDVRSLGSDVQAWNIEGNLHNVSRKISAASDALTLRNCSLTPYSEPCLLDNDPS